jgi:hypothetical protein
MTTTRSQKRHTELFSQNRDKDYDMYSINVKPGDRTSHSSLGGIEVTTEMSIMQGSTKHELTKHENSSERRLVTDV